MTDYFALLGMPRRAVLDDDFLKEAFVRRSEKLHRETDTTAELQLLNEAFRILQNPSSRIRHLLELKDGPPISTEANSEVAQLFGQVMRAIEEFDRRFDSAASENSPVLRAMHINDLTAAEDGLEAIRISVEKQERRLHDELNGIDRDWLAHGEKQQRRLAQIAAELSFLQRWSGQIRERTLRFEELV